MKRNMCFFSSFRKNDFLLYLPTEKWMKANERKKLFLVNNDVFRNVMKCIVPNPRHSSVTSHIENMISNEIHFSNNNIDIDYKKKIIFIHNNEHNFNLYATWNLKHIYLSRTDKCPGLESIVWQIENINSQ